MSGVYLCRKFEGVSLNPYLCQAGVPTIGYGSTRYADGEPVKMTDGPISEQKADELFTATIQHFWAELITNIPSIQKFNQRQAGALLSFAYNTGWTRLNTGYFDTLDHAVVNEPSAIADTLKMYNKAAGEVSLGLTRRRYAERLLFNGVDWTAAYNEAMTLTA